MSSSRPVQQTEKVEPESRKWHCTRWRGMGQTGGTDLSGQSVCLGVCGPRASTHAIAGRRRRPCKRPHALAGVYSGARSLTRAPGPCGTSINGQHERRIISAYLFSLNILSSVAKNISARHARRHRNDARICTVTAIGYVHWFCVVRSLRSECVSVHGWPSALRPRH